jgi:dUTP pyrophosphatase
MTNLGKEDYSVSKGSKIAQLLIQPITTVDVIEVDTLSETVRGENGHGSTGVL